MISVDDTMGLSLLVFMQLFSKSHCPMLDILPRKLNLTRNSHSESFKVMHFGISEKPTRDCVSLYNNAGLIPKVNSQRQRWKLPLSTTPLSFDAPAHRTPANISINLILPERRIGYSFAADSRGLPSFRFLWWARKDAIEWVTALQVIQPHWFWYQSKGPMRLPISY